MRSQGSNEHGFLRRLVRDEAGLTSLEYGIIAALLAVAAIPAINALGGEVREGMDDTTSDLQSTNQGLQNGNGSGNTNRNGFDPGAPEEPAPVGDPMPNNNSNTPDEPVPAAMAPPVAADEPVPAAMKAPPPAPKADEPVPSNGLM